MTKFRKRVAYSIAVVAVPGLLLMTQMVGETTAVTSYIANTIFANNLHEVIPGRFFRSAEMSRSRLQETIKAHNIKTVIDMRLDSDAPDSTGLSEAEAARLAGASYLHLPFSSARADQLDQLSNLLAAFDSAKLPILVHCSSGTHRSGVAAALWLLEKERKSYEEAMVQLSPRYGFFQFERDLKSFFQGSPTLDKILTRYKNETVGTNASLKSWIDAQITSPSETKDTETKDKPAA